MRSVSSYFLLAFSLMTTAEEIYENSTNICTRCDCTQTADARIFTLDCSNKNFIHMLASWPSDNATTIKASFAHNDFTRLQKLPPTDATVEVVLSQCNIEELDSAPFDTSVNIKFLDLSHNMVKSEQLTSSTFRGPYNDTKPEPIALEELDLSYNQIHSLPKNLFKYTPKLKRLNLRGNDFTLLDIHTQLALTSVSGLMSLNLAENELDELVMGAIAGLKNLRQVDLSINELDFVPHSLNAVRQSLQVVILDGNPIIEMVEESFEGLDNLIEISANNLTKLHHVNTSTFTTTPKLKKLSLSNNPSLTDISIGAFTLNETIEELYLNNNNLSTLPFDLLIWGHLTALDLKDNPWICSCDLHKIVSSLPSSISRNSNGPTCFDPFNSVTVMLYDLKEDICEEKSLPSVRKTRVLRHHFSVPLVGLIVTLMMGLGVAIGLGYTRYRRFMTSRDEYASQVFYTPLFNRTA